MPLPSFSILILIRLATTDNNEEVSFLLHTYLCRRVNHGSDGTLSSKRLKKSTHLFLSIYLPDMASLASAESNDGKVEPATASGKDTQENPVGSVTDKLSKQSLDDNKKDEKEKSAAAVDTSKQTKEDTVVQEERKKPKRNVVVKVGMVGDAQIGKTTLMVKYVEGQFEEDYIETLGVNFMEKSITLKSTEVTFSIWDLGGQREFATMLPLVCNDAVAILFMFDLSNKSTLSSVKEWYRQVRGLNKDAFAILVGTKYDLYLKMSEKDQKEVTKQAKKYAKAMKAPLIFSSASHSVNVNKIFKILLAKVFGLKCNIPKITKQGDPLCMGY